MFTYEKCTSFRFPGLCLVSMESFIQIPVKLNINYLHGFLRPPLKFIFSSFSFIHHIDFDF